MSKITAPKAPEQPKQIDPNPNNLLGKGILPPDEEAKLLAEGCIYAEYFYPKSGRPPIIVASKRPYIEAVNELFRSARQPVLPV